MALVLQLGFVVGAASGLAVAALGVAALLARRRPLAVHALGWLGLAWGGAVALANLAQMATDAEVVHVATLAFLALYILLPIPLVLLLCAVPPRPRSTVVAAVIAAAAFAAPLLVLLAARPTAYFVPQRTDELSVSPGPLFDVVVTTSSVLLFAAALAVATFRLARSSKAPQLELVVAALVAYVGFRAGELAAIVALDPTSLAIGGAAAVGTSWLGLVLCAGATAGAVAVAARRSDLEWRSLVLVLGLVAPLAAFVEVLLDAGFTLVGGWRLVAVALLAYAVARYRVFDIELRLAAAAPAAAYLVTAGLGLLVLWAAAGPALAGSLPLGTLAVAGLALACVPAARLGAIAQRRVAPHVREPEYLYKRKVDVYRAALEEAQAKGLGHETEQAFLSELRRGLGISEQEHKLLVLIVESQQRFDRPRAALAGGKYAVERELGRGSFGQAVLARDRALDRPVVMKRPLGAWALEGEGRALFEREARIAAQIQHPNVVTVYGLETAEEPPALLLEYVEGGSLERALRDGPLPLQRALAIERDVLRGLAAIHARGIVHRDLKPANVLLTREGVAKITDFGVAHEATPLAATIAASGAQPGSIPYMSPEQARGEPVDARSDLYSAALLLYRMVAGRDAFDLAGRSAAQARALVAEARPLAPPAGLPPAVAAALARALEPDRARRFATADEMLAALGPSGNTVVSHPALREPS